MKLKDLLKENWDVKDGKVLSNGKLVGYYEFDRDSDSFWVDDVQKGKGQLSFDSKREVEDYFKKNEKDAIKHLGKLRESLSEETASEIIKDLDKVRNDLIKKVDVLIAKKKKLYSNVDITTPMSADEKQLDKDIQSIFSQIQQIIQQKRKIKNESINEATMHPMTRERALDNLREVILNIKPYSREVVKHCEAAIAIIEKFEAR
jgi:hypothetical protein